MRLGSRIRYFACFVFLVLFLRMAGHSATGAELSFFPQNVPVSWRSDAGHNVETLIRGQNRYTRYLRNYSLWGNLYGYDGRLRPKSSVFNTLKSTDTGMQFGIDLPSGEMFACGFYYSNASPTLSVMSSPISSLDGGELETTNHNFGLRWTSYGEEFFMQFGINGGFDKYRLKNVSLGQSDGSGWQMGGNAEFGLVVDELAGWRVRPHLTFDYRWLQHNDIGVLFDDGSYDALYSNFGLRVFRPLGPILEWQTRLSWLHNYLASDDPIRIQRFGSVPGLSSPTQLFLDGNLGRDWIWFGTGLKLHFGNFFNVFVDYDLAFNKYETMHCGSVMVLLRW
jgi:hypothetical protein